MIPQKLENWTYKVIKELVKKNVNESDRHDFKKEMPDSETLTKTCCAFANTKGGFIVLGVKEKGSSFEIVGISNDKELAHNFGRKVKANPTIDFSLPKIIPIPKSEKIIAVFEIPLSAERPHIPDFGPEKRLFQKRTNKGNDYMSYEEIRFSFSDYHERREKINLLYIELLSNLEILNDLKIKDSEVEDKYSLLSIDNTIINGLLMEIYSSISINKELVKLLFDIKRSMSVLNNKIAMFFSIVPRPLTSKEVLFRQHNEFVNKFVDDLIPDILRAAEILEAEFNLTNPLESDELLKDSDTKN